MSETHLINIPVISVGEGIELLAEDYVAAIQNGESARNVDVTFLWGSGGVGKTSILYQAADVVRQRTSRKVCTKVLYMPDYAPDDIKIPMPDMVNHVVETLVLKEFVFDPDPEVVHMVLLDELSDLSERMQQIVMQMVLERKIGGYILPDNTFFMAAGNRENGLGKVYRFRHQLANRLTHFHVLADYGSWKKWAEAHDIHPYIIGYLNENRSMLNRTNIKADELAFPTPRSWERVNRYMNRHVGKSPRDLYSYISGVIGEAETLEFVAWCEANDEMVSAEAVLKGTVKKYPEKQSQMIRLMNSMVELIGEAADEEEMKQLLENAYRYMRMKKYVLPEYAQSFHDRVITEIPEAAKLLRTMPHLWKGIGGV